MRGEGENGGNEGNEGKRKRVRVSRFFGGKSRSTHGEMGGKRELGPTEGNIGSLSHFFVQKVTVLNGMLTEGVYR